MALTDINNTSACLDFIRMAPQFHIRPVVGIDFRNGIDQCFVALAKNNEGFQEINTFLTHHLHHDTPIPKRAPRFQHAFIIYPFANTPTGRLTANEFVGIHPREVNQVMHSQWADHPDKWVILSTTTFRNKTDFNAHRLLRAIDNNTILSKLPESAQGHIDDRFYSPEELEQAFQYLPSAIHNTNSLLEDCQIHFDFGNEHPHKNLKHYAKNAEIDEKLIRKLCQEGLHYRYPNADQKILDRIEKELDIIIQKGFVSYFLINWDILCYARSQGYFYVGRGSGANSVVAYLLRITDVDPIDLDLYFERFINLITRYIFERFPNTALLATYNTFQYKAVVRELGKVFGLPKTDIDRLSAGGFQMKDLDHLSRLVIQYSTLIQGLPNHLSIHAGGILISEKPITSYTATFMPPKGYPTTQFDMVVAEDVGLYKFDILSQRGLGKIRDAIEIVAQNRPNDPVIDIHDIQGFKKDQKVKNLLRNAKAIGCFYVESPAMRMLLKKLRVDDYMGLVAASSIIRPGVAKSGMMREYILRFRHPEKRKDAHPIMLDIMPDTFGVMVYQEDVIKVAHYFAGLTLGEADMLRRGMSGKFRSREEFNKVKQQFFNNCKEKGHSVELTREIWRQIESFAGYAFAKGHSASYAVESFQSLFLKAYYPLEYMVATINNFGGFYRTEIYFHEARRHGANIQLPCINQSRYETCINNKDIFIGFIHLHSFEVKVAKKIVEERALNGPFLDFDDFLYRVPISVDQAAILIRVNAFRFTGKSKRALLWEAHLKLNKKPRVEEAVELFRVPMKKYDLPRLNSTIHEDIFDEMELIGFPVSGNPFLLAKNPIIKDTTVRHWPANKGKVVTTTGYLVTVKKTKTGNGKLMFFGTFLDRDGRFVDTVHFPPVAARHPFRGKGLYQLTGRIVEEFGFYSMEVRTMHKLAIIEDPRYSEPRKKYLLTPTAAEQDAA
jgi:DNA polymerase-3 subunit alpha